MYGNWYFKSVAEKPKHRIEKTRYIHGEISERVVREGVDRPAKVHTLPSESPEPPIRGTINTLDAEPFRLLQT